MKADQNRQKWDLFCQRDDSQGEKRYYIR